MFGRKTGTKRPVIFFFFFNDPATTEIYTSIDTLSLHDALPIYCGTAWPHPVSQSAAPARNRSEEHTSELQSPIDISYAVFCLKKKKNNSKNPNSALITHKKTNITGQNTP